MTDLTALAEVRVGAVDADRTEAGATTVSAEGMNVGTFDDHEDAHSMADAWNGAYPPSEGYPEFVVDGCDGGCGYAD